MFAKSRLREFVVAQWRSGICIGAVHPAEMTMDVLARAIKAAPSMAALSDVREHAVNALSESTSHYEQVATTIRDDVAPSLDTLSNIGEHTVKSIAETASYCKHAVIDMSTVEHHVTKAVSETMMAGEHLVNTMHSTTTDLLYRPIDYTLTYINSIEYNHSMLLVIVPLAVLNAIVEHHNTWVIVGALLALVMIVISMLVLCIRLHRWAISFTMMILRRGFVWLCVAVVFAAITAAWIGSETVADYVVQMSARVAYAVVKTVVNAARWSFWMCITYSTI